MSTKRIILDTNLWISFLISNRLNFIDNLLYSGIVKLIFSNELIEEFISVAQRPKFKKYFDDEKISDILRLFDNYGELVKVSSKTEICRDRKDNFLLNLAVDGKANYLITGDSDLLIINEIHDTKIITWSDFKEEMK